MKKIFLLLLISGLWSLASGSTPAQAKVKKETFKKAKPMTQGQLFLNQVDTICLYLTTPNVVYTPKLDEENQLKVTLTFLDVAEEPHSESLRAFTMRHIETFKKTLKERMEFYTPEMAEEFDFDKDVEFFIQMGANRQRVARYAEEKWFWVESSGGKRVYKETKPLSEMSACKKKCPAMIGSKMKPKEEMPPEVAPPANPPQAEEPEKEEAPKGINGENLPL